MNKQQTKTQSGITLVALIITIIVLLILAIVSIRAIQQGGIIGKSQNAVNSYSESEEKEKINLAANEALIAGTGSIQEEKLSEALTNQFKNDWEFGTNTKEYFEVKIKSTQRTYKIYTNGKIEKKEPTGGNPGTSEQSDFTHTGGTITGLSEKGLAKLNAGQTAWVIPNKIGEDTITAIGEMAFIGLDKETGKQPSDYSKITSIEIPKGVTSIAQMAFGACTSLENVIIPEGLQEIGQSAFGMCSSLETITIPEGVQTIGVGAFMQTSLKTITIPEGVITVGEFAFACNTLEEIILPSTITSIGDDTDSFDATTNLKTIKINQTADEIRNIEGIRTVKSYTQILDKDGNVVTVE